MTEPRVLLLDIETLPNVGLFWSLRVDGYLSHDNIIQERTILCAAWKWLGSPRVRSIAVRARVRGNPEEEDRRILKRLWKEIAMADAVVAHNGDRFDMKWVRARLVMLGLPPLKPVIQIDTKKIAKDNFYFNSNRLDYLGKKLGVGGKIKTDYDLWLECLTSRDPATRRKGLAKMVKYNKHDVEVLEGVYLKLRPFVTTKLNRALFSDDPERTCPHCGEPHALVKQGYNYTRVGIRIAFRCRFPKCQSWSYYTSNKIPR